MVAVAAGGAETVRLAGQVEVATPESGLRPRLPEAVPASDLTPLGWDPRSIVGKGSAE